MAVVLEFINIIIPIKNIENCSGGFKQLLKEEGDLIGQVNWYDEHLYRTGVMNPHDIQDIVEDWQKRGLTPIIEKDGKRIWNDLCVVDSFEGLTLPCDWIKVDLENQCAWLKGKPEGEIVGRDSGEHGGVMFVPNF